MPGDDDLVRAAQAGDHAAFAELYCRYVRMVHAIALSRAGAALADDVVQEVFLKAMRRLCTLRDVAAFGGWLASITRNTVTSLQRRARSESGEEPPDAAAPGSTHHDLEAQAALEAIRSLPRAYRETLMMRLVSGLTGPEIAARTGLSPGSVRVNLHRGMKLLRAHLEQAVQAEAR